MKPIANSDQVYYIKLGKGGGWEEECIEKEQTIKIGWNKCSHRDCLQKKWTKVQRFSLRSERSKSSATKATNAIKNFYELDCHTLWITFHANRMCWCFAEEKVRKTPDGDKIRKAIGKWRDTDIQGTPLSLDSLKGNLLKMRRFQGTICYVYEWQYVIDKINAKTRPEVKKASNAKASLRKALLPLVQQLTWGDFEILVDLIFTRTGWQRVGALGGPQKSMDVDLLSPVTGERAMLQIKSTSNRRQLGSYVRQFREMKGYGKMFYVVHSPDGSFSKLRLPSSVRLITGEQLCEHIIDGGLSSWLIRKSS